MSFASLGLNDEIVLTLQQLQYQQPTPIQEQAIPVVLNKHDVIACAQTGTGKTAAFVLPILQRISEKEWTEKGRRPVRALILAPTRELAVQIGQSVRTYSQGLHMRSFTIFGGVSINPQMMRLRGGVDVLIATPGRLLDLEHQNAVDLSKVEVLVLDEADRMLDMGFLPDINRVLKKLPAKRQNLLFSATISDEVKNLADRFLVKPVFIEVASRNAPSDLVNHTVHLVNHRRKRELLSHLIGKEQWHQVLVFTRTKQTANYLTDQLNKDGIKASAIHGDKSQGARMRALTEFKEGQVRVLVATDIAARGLDIQQLPHVVNYELPLVAEDYIHRIGRTGRADCPGEALSLVCEDEYPLLQEIELLLGRQIPRISIVGYESHSTGSIAPKHSKGASNQALAQKQELGANRHRTKRPARRNKIVPTSKQDSSKKEAN